MNLRQIVAGLCLAALAGQALAQEAFKVCADPLNPPYSTKNQDGFENKIAELFAQKLGQKLEYTWFPQRIGFVRNTLTAPVDEHAVDSTDFKCDVIIGVPTGFDMVMTTKPYYHSTYVLLIAKGRGFDDIADPMQLANLPITRQEALKIAMFDRSPGTAWLQKVGLLDQGIPYQSMSGDETSNVAIQMDQDLKTKKIDMAILWGPVAGYILGQAPKGSYAVLPMHSTPDVKFDYSMAMGVRRDDKARKAILEKLIAENASIIESIIKTYQVPLLPIPKPTKHGDDD